MCDPRIVSIVGKTVAEAEVWAIANGYKLRVIRSESAKMTLEHRPDRINALIAGDVITRIYSIG